MVSAVMMVVRGGVNGRVAAVAAVFAFSRVNHDWRRWHFG